MTHAMIAGCSHTAGVGLDTQYCYTSRLAEHYNISVLNRGISGGGCNEVLMNVVDCVKQSNNYPKFVVAQWPNPFRKSLWINNQKILQNVNSCDHSFEILLKNSDKNFYEPWAQSIIVANLLCKLSRIPIINIVLETVNNEMLQRLNEENITLHHDEKLPGKSWIFDHGASDGIHHSAQCHQLWAQRLIGIIDEYTTQ
jgi:hypothetical protein